MKSIVPVLCLVLLALGVGGVGCRRQASAPNPIQTTPSEVPALTKPALTAWQQGDRPSAVSNFVATDWAAGPVFGPDSVLSLSEEQFKAGIQPVLASGAPTATVTVKALQTRMMDELKTMKQLVGAVAQAGREAAATNNVALARQHFESVQRYATTLNTTNSLAILRLDAQAALKLAQRELAALPTP